MKKNKKIIIVIGVIIGLLVIGALFLIFKNNIFTTVDTSVKNSNTEYRISDNALSNFDLYFLQKENNSKNKVYSPLSIKYALSMLKDGTSGDSKKQIENAALILPHRLLFRYHGAYIYWQSQPTRLPRRLSFSPPSNQLRSP